MTTPGREKKSHRDLLDRIADLGRFAVFDYPVALSLGALRAVVELHEPRLTTVYAAGERQMWICGHCADLRHSRSGLACDTPTDGFYPCSTIEAVAKALTLGKR